MKNIIIIGSGIAGLSAACKASENNLNVKLISPDYSERSQSILAMGGINASLNTKGQNDSPEDHYNDTIKSGQYINNFKAVKNLTSSAVDIVNWLSEIGVDFTRDENGNIDLRPFGGQKKIRTAYAGTTTGLQIVSKLITLCRKYEVEGNVERIVGWRFLSLILNNQNECCGVVCYNETTSEIKEFTSDAVIIATGGLNEIFGNTSGSIHNDGYTTGRLFKQGVELANLEMIQYHPTTIKTPQKRMLISEAARGEGGRLFVLKENKPWYFMEEWYPEFGALMSRDIVSQSIYKVSKEYGTVYLDVSHLPKKVVKTKLDEVYKIVKKQLNIDITEEPFPVFPGVHFFMGGIKTDENHRTNINRLYAIGECSCQYHGANRLGGNSLLGAVCGGLTAVKDALKLTDIHENYTYKKESYNSGDILIFEIEEKLHNIMFESMGIYRNEKDLENALTKLEELEKIAINLRGNYYEYVKIPISILIAKAMVLSALNRKESRGAHQRDDYPETLKEFEKITCAKFENEQINISFEDVNL